MSESYFIPYASPEIGEEEIAEVVDSLRSGWLTSGPKVNRFEQEFADFLGDGGVHAVAVNSATAGLHLALESLGVGPGDEVITTTYTFTATAEVIRYVGAEPVLVDIDPATYCLSPEDVARKITEKTRAVIAVHFGGLAAPMDEILHIARQHRLHVIEDAAHAVSTTHQGRLVGTLDTDVAVFSFYANKPITTGEGGMLVTRSEEIAQRARVMRLHGINRDVFDRYSSKAPSWYYEVLAPGFKYNMTDIAASIGIHQLRKLSQFNVRRQEIAEKYFQLLMDLPIVLPPKPKAGDVHSWHLFVLQLREDSPMTRDEFINALHANGIGASVHYVPLHVHPFWRSRYALTDEMFPESQHLYERCVSIPLYSKLSDEAVGRIVSTIRRLLGG